MRFPGAWFALDTTSAKMVAEQSSHDAMKVMSKNSWFRWSCDDPHEVQSWGDLRLVQSRTIIDAGDDILKSVPWPYGFISRYMPWLIRGMVSGYKINLFVVGSAASKES